MNNEYELAYQPESLLREVYVNLVHYTDNLNLGHFAAFEEPKIVANDIGKAVKNMEDHHRKKK